MVRKGVLCFAALMLLIPGLLYGLVIGTSNLPEATGPNHTSHIAHWSNWTIASAVYQSMSGGQYRSHYVCCLSDEILERDTIGGAYENVAYPAIAISYPVTISTPMPVSFPIEAIVYLSGTIGGRCVYIPPDSVCFPVGNRIRIATHDRIAGDWDYQTVWSVGGSYVRASIPSIAYAYQTDYEPPIEVHFIITFVAYRDSTVGYDHDLFLVDWVVEVDNSGNLTSYQDAIISTSGGIHPINPSTATYFWDVPETGPSSNYLHIAWRQPLWPPIETTSTPGAIGYRVMRRPEGGSWGLLGTVTLEIDDGYSFPPGIYHSHPHISRYGDRVFLSWRMEDYYPDRLGEIVRRRKRITYWDDRGDTLRWHWEPSIVPYVQPESISTWDGGHNSDTLDSNYPQGSGTGVIWQEEYDTSPYDWEVWIRDREPDYFPYDWSWNGHHLNTMDDIYSNIDEQVFICVELDGDSVHIEAQHWILQTSQISASSYNVECLLVEHWDDPTYGRFSSIPLGNGSLIQIGSAVPVFYMITCGDSAPSFYCKKRDGYDNINGYPVDKGTQELIYHLPFLEPSLHYLVRAVVIAPDTIIETFGFDSVDMPVAVTPEPETLDFILPDSIYQDRYVQLTIYGENGAYLSNIKVYQYEVIQDSGYQKSPGIASLSPSALRTKLFVTPSLFSSAASIKYEIAKKEEVSLAVYDASGRLIRSLIKTQIQESGVYTVFWNGINENGRSLPAGIYFIRLETEGSALTRKVILMR